VDHSAGPAWLPPAAHAEACASSGAREGWLRTLADPLAAELRREWSRLRELPKDELTLDAIQRLVALETRRGIKGA
jgi:hypothetical protein